MKIKLIMPIFLLILMLCSCTVQQESPLSPSEIAAYNPTPSESAQASATADELSAGQEGYAHMFSFDPKTGYAKFDYFEMLRGQDAVAWLVEQEGYTQEDAQALVNEFTPSEFIEKNIDSPLRTVDLSNVPVTMIVNNNGTLDDPIQPRIVDFNTLKVLYSYHPDAVIKLFFYRINIDDHGNVESVEQVHWP